MCDHSLLFDLVSSSAPHVPCVHLSLAAVPQVHVGFGDIQQNHGGPRAKTAAVTHHLQQVALYWLLSSHTVQAPVIYTKVKQTGLLSSSDNMCDNIKQSITMADPRMIQLLV